MDIVNLLVISIVGLIAGFVNTVAGGGSLLTMGAMILMGLPSQVANGTNRIAILISNITALINFKKRGYFDFKFGIMLAIPAVVGSILGANIAINMPDELFNRILGLIMLVVIFMIIRKPHKGLSISLEDFTPTRKIVSMITFFFVGIYGGFIQAGVGFIIMAALVFLTGLSLVKINSLKVFVISIYTISSLVVFVFSGNVDWIIGFILAISTSIGAWLGATFSVERGDKWIKAVLAISMVGMSGRLLGLY